VRGRLCSEQGVALVTAVMSMMLMTALGSALILTTMTEAGIGAHYVRGLEAFYAADAALERTLSDLPAVADWSSLLGVRFDGPVADLMPAASAASQLHVRVTVATATVEGAIVVRAQAFGPGDIQRTVEATVSRTGQPGPAAVRLLAWKDIRQ
jgi:Tfp pilus assembly protein PilX